ncbi:MAG: XapX domain-containing protein [Steroidobacteraceae bacterium]
MRPFLVSLIVGAAVGAVYGLIGVRSPAPPAIALLGLLGMLAGERVVSMVRPNVFGSNAGAPIASSSIHTSADVEGTVKYSPRPLDSAKHR